MISTCIHQLLLTCSSMSFTLCFFYLHTPSKIYQNNYDTPKTGCLVHNWRTHRGGQERDSKQTQVARSYLCVYRKVSHHKQPHGAKGCGSETTWCFWIDCNCAIALTGLKTYIPLFVWKHNLYYFMFTQLYSNAGNCH